MDRPKLDRPRIIAAARDLVAREGLDRLTMRALSAELGVEAPSLYGPVRDKGDILDGLAELVWGEVSPPTEDAVWSIRVRRYCENFRRVLLSNPELVPVLAVRPVVGLSTLDLVEVALGELRDLDMSPRDAVFTLDTLVAFVIGHALSELSADPTLSGHDPAAISAARAALPADRYPNVRETLAEGGVDRTAEFNHGLDLLIRGLASVLDEQG